MTILAESAARRPLPHRRALAAALIAAGLAVLLAANGHFLYVAMMSQPDCVAHSKEPASGVAGGLYQAATPAC